MTHIIVLLTPTTTVTLSGMKPVEFLFVEDPLRIDITTIWVVLAVVVVVLV